MIENDISLERRFSTNCMAHLPSKSEDWTVTESDLKERKDLRLVLELSYM